MSSMLLLVVVVIPDYDGTCTNYPIYHNEYVIMPITPPHSVHVQYVVTGGSGYT